MKKRSTFVILNRKVFKHPRLKKVKWALKSVFVFFRVRDREVAASATLGWHAMYTVIQKKDVIELELNQN